MRKLTSFGFILLFLLVSLFQTTFAQQQIGNNERNYLYIKNSQGNQIRIFEDGGNYFSDFPLPSDITVDEMGICPCGGFILGFDQSKQSLYHIDDETGDIIWKISPINDVGVINVSKHKTRYCAVTNTRDHSIRLYSEKGKAIRTIQSEGRWKQIDSICIDDWNHIWVVDKSTSSVYFLSEKGKTKKKLTSTSSYSLQNSISCNSDHGGRMYVLTSSGSIHVFTKDAKYIRSFSIKNKPSTPNSIGIDPTLNTIFIQYTSGAFSRIQNDGTIIYTINKPFSVTKKEIIQLKIGSRLLINYRKGPAILDFAPFIDSSTSRTYVPIRAITESFGAKVQWDSKSQKVSIQLDSIKIILQIGNKKATVNNKTLTLDAPPTIVNNRTFVPLRFISEALGASVQWIAESRTIKIVRE